MTIHARSSKNPRIRSGECQPVVTLPPTGREVDFYVQWKWDDAVRGEDQREGTKNELSRKGC